MKKFMSFIVAMLFASYVYANPPVGTYRSTPNGSGGANYYSSKNQFLGRSTSRGGGGFTYYNKRNSVYNQTNRSGTTIGKFQAPSNGGLKYSSSKSNSVYSSGKK